MEAQWPQWLVHSSPDLAAQAQAGHCCVLGQDT